MYEYFTIALTKLIVIQICYPICEKGGMENKQVDFKIYGVSLGKFPAQVCDSCGETFFSESTSDKIDELAKKKGLWGLESKTRVGMVGNSIDVKINKKIAAFAGLKKGNHTDITIRKGASLYYFNTKLGEENKVLKFYIPKTIEQKLELDKGETIEFEILRKFGLKL